MVVDESEFGVAKTCVKYSVAAGTPEEGGFVRTAPPRCRHTMHIALAVVLKK